MQARDQRGYTALRLARHLGTSARFWMNLQNRYASRSPRAATAPASPPTSTAPHDRSGRAVRKGFF